MLRHLLIKNYALIEHLELPLDAGLSIVTGETGAGKSIMLGAIGLLTGARTDGKALWDPTQKCVVEGVFDVTNLGLEAFFEENGLDYDADTLIRREIAPSGKSRAFINDSPATLDVLKAIGVYLLDIHSQHDSLQLGSAQYQLSILDKLAGNTALLTKYQSDYRQWLAAQQAFEDVKATVEREKASLDYNKFQLDQLLNANLVGGEDREAEQELSVLDNAEELTQRLDTALTALDNGEVTVVQLLKSAIQSTEKVASMMPKAAELAERLSTLLPEVRDLVDELETLLQQVEPDPKRQDLLNERLMTLASLQKKHLVASVDELITLRDDLKRKVAITENQDIMLAEAAELAKAAEGNMMKTATQLSEARKDTIPGFEKQLADSLAAVALSQASVKVELLRTKPTLLGIDGAKILFTANKGTAPREISQVASGGEFSRLMLCIKYLLAQHTQLPTIIFDEIDTGISGEVALQVGKMVKQMSAKHQMMVITHLPQMAAQGNVHLYVYKDHSSQKTVSSIKRLDHQQRVAELAQMMSGSTTSTLALESAQELLLAVND
jgi:DNA repair protein RecN (Recombination protein N)